MKKLYSFLTIFCLFGLFFTLTPSEAGAVDVYAYTADNKYDGQFDAYVVTDSIRWNVNHTMVICMVKEVHDGRIINVRRWALDNFMGHWRYMTPEMKNHTSRVIPGGWSDKILQICFNNL